MLLDMTEPSESFLRELHRAAEARAKANRAVVEATASLHALVLEGYRAGVSELRLTKESGLARETVRKWLGK